MGNRKENAAAPRRGNGAHRTSTKGQSIASTGERTAVLIRGGWPVAQTKVFGVYTNFATAQDMATALRRRLVDAWVEPAGPRDGPGQVRRGR
mgnify:CR=1 FL=1